MTENYSVTQHLSSQPGLHPRDVAKKNLPRGLVDVAVERREGVDGSQRRRVEVIWRVAVDAVGDVIPLGEVC